MSCCATRSRCIGGTCASAAAISSSRPNSAGGSSTAPWMPPSAPSAYSPAVGARKWGEGVAASGLLPPALCACDAAHAAARPGATRVPRPRAHGAAHSAHHPLPAHPTRTRPPCGAACLSRAAREGEKAGAGRQGRRWPQRAGACWAGAGLLSTAPAPCAPASAPGSARRHRGTHPVGHPRSAAARCAACGGVVRGCAGEAGAAGLGGRRRRRAAAPRLRRRGCDGGCGHGALQVGGMEAAGGAAAAGAAAARRRRRRRGASGERRRTRSRGSRSPPGS
jgi:hypothetical protein